MNAVVLATQVGLRAASVGVLALVLGPSGQGEVVLGYLVATVGGGLAGVGLDVALMRSIATDEQRLAARSAVWTQTLLATAASGIALALVVLTSAPLGVVFGVVAVPPLLLTRLAASAALGGGHDRMFATLTIAPWGANALGVALLAAAHELTPRRALLAFALASGASGVGCLLFSGSWLRPRLDRDPRRNEVYRVAFRVYPGLVAQLGNYRLDQVVIAALLPRAELGLYSLAVAGSELATLPAQATANAILPRVSRPGGARRVPYAAMVAAAAVALAIIPAFAVFLKIAVPEYEGALIPLLLLLPGTIGVAASKVVGATLTGWGEPWHASRIAIATFALTLVGVATLIPILGLTGAALTSSVAYCMSAALLVVTARTLASRPPGTAGNPTSGGR